VQAAPAPAPVTSATPLASDWQLISKDGEGSEATGQIGVNTLENATLFITGWGAGSERHADRGISQCGRIDTRRQVRLGSEERALTHSSG
jgi:hypothetical protein